MGGKLGVNVALARALGSQFDQVIVALAVRHQAHQLQQLSSAPKERRIEADALHQQVDPLVGGKGAPGLQVLAKVKTRKLDRLERVEDPGDVVPLVVKLVSQVGDAPHAAHQQLGVALDGIDIHQYLLDAQVGKGGLVGIPLFVQVHTDLVNDLVPPALADGGADQTGFAAVDVMLAQNLLDRLHPGLDTGLVRSGTVLAQEVFEDIGGDDGVALDQLDEVFAHHHTWKLVVDFLVELVHLVFLG